MGLDMVVLEAVECIVSKGYYQGDSRDLQIIDGRPD